MPVIETTEQLVSPSEVSIGPDRSSDGGFVPRPIETAATHFSRRWVGIVDAGGRVLIVIGALVLLFLGFQLWGTGLQERQAQRGLADELERTIEAHGEQLGLSERLGVRHVADAREGADHRPLFSDGTPADSERLDPFLVPSRPRPDAGAAVARLEAPTIDLDKTVVEGVGRPQLREGPGLYPVSPPPGHLGNVAIAGHRTTHGSPFAKLDELEPGDPITLETVDGIFTYRVEEQQRPDGTVSGHRIVSPDDVHVIADQGDNRLTLTSCHPRYSDRQRLIVSAVLEGLPVAFASPSASPHANRRELPDRLVSEAQRWPLKTADPSGRSSNPEGPLAETARATFDEPFQWHWQRLDEVLLWASATLLALLPLVLVYRRRHRAIALALAPLILGYPAVVLMTKLDMLAPAL